MNKNSNLVPRICSVQYADIRNITSIDEGSTSQHRTVTFKGINDWIDMYGSLRSIKYEEPIKDTPAGIQYLKKLELLFPGLDEANNDDFADFSNYRYVVKFTYTSGIVKIFGSLENPVIAYANYSDDKNGYVILFSQNDRYKAFLYET